MPVYITKENPSGSVGARIRHLRQQLGLTQEQLGERAELHYSYIGQVERGDKMPSLRSLKKLAAALNVDVNYFFEEEAPYTAALPTNFWQKELLSLTNNRPPEDIHLLIEMAKVIFQYLDKIKRTEDPREDRPPGPGSGPSRK